MQHSLMLSAPMDHVAPAWRTSVARPLLAGLLAISMIATGGGSLLGVNLFRQEAEAQRKRDLATYAEERTKYEQVLFQDLCVFVILSGLE